MNENWKERLQRRAAVRQDSTQWKARVENTIHALSTFKPASMGSPPESIEAEAGVSFKLVEEQSRQLLTDLVSEDQKIERLESELALLRRVPAAAARSKPDRFRIPYRRALQISGVGLALFIGGRVLLPFVSGGVEESAYPAPEAVDVAYEAAVVQQDRPSETEANEYVEEVRNYYWGYSARELTFPERANIVLPPGIEPPLGVMITGAPSIDEHLGLGIRVGDILVQVDSMRIRSLQDFGSITNEPERMAPGTIVVWRSGQYEFLPLARPQPFSESDKTSLDDTVQRIAEATAQRQGGGAIQAAGEAGRIGSPMATSDLAITTDHFSLQPGYARIDAFYPDRARKSGQAGFVQLRCKVGTDQTIACEVLREEPESYGLGNAAIRYSKEVRVRTELPDGSLSAGRTFEFVLDFSSDPSGRRIDITPRKN